MQEQQESESKAVGDSGVRDSKVNLAKEPAADESRLSLRESYVGRYFRGAKDDFDKTGDVSGTPSVFRMAAFGYALLWLSFPPVGLAPLAWFAMVPVFGLILEPTLGSKRPYWKLFAAGLLYWLATFYFVPIPHPALWAGWAAVSLYMAVYTPLSVAIGRTMVHRLNVPAAIAIPVVWTGIEWIRCHFATGMGMVCVSHSQARYPALIQLASVFGAYGVTFVIATVAACLALAWRAWRVKSLEVNAQKRRPSWVVYLLIGVVVFALNFLYGVMQSSMPEEIPGKSFKVALVQTSQDAIFRPPTEDEMRDRVNETIELTRRAMMSKPNLVCWPESGLFPYRWQLEDAGKIISAVESEKIIQEYWRQAVARDLTGGAPLLSGVLAQNYPEEKIYNSAVLIDQTGDLTERYDKNHPVMFGEYIPFGKMFPVLERLAPMRSIEFGVEFKAYEIDGFKVAPSICFETTVPHLIRRQINELAAAGEEPDVLINLTNDGWFFGTACLDHHLACNIFRAIEMRKPHLICANTGFSADIDRFGNIRSLGPRRDTDVIVAEIGKSDSMSPYRRIGDVVPLLFGLIILVVALVGKFTSYGITTTGKSTESPLR